MTARRSATEDTTAIASPNKHKAIVEAARELFTSEGYEATTIADVARKAGVAVGTVYLYFKNKNDLLFAVKGDWDEEIIGAFSRPELASIPIRFRVRPLMESMFAIVGRNTEMVQLMGMQPEMIGHLYEKDGSRIQRAIETFIVEAQDAGVVRPVDPWVTAIIAYGMVEHALCQCFEVERGKNQDHYIDALVYAFTQWLVIPES